jgi:hypothetical protein
MARARPARIADWWDVTLRSPIAPAQRIDIVLNTCKFFHKSSLITQTKSAIRFVGRCLRVLGFAAPAGFSRILACLHALLVYGLLCSSNRAGGKMWFSTVSRRRALAVGGQIPSRPAEFGEPHARLLGHECVSQVLKPESLWRSSRASGGVSPRTRAMVLHDAALDCGRRRNGRLGWQSYLYEPRGGGLDRVTVRRRYGETR